LLVRRGHVQAGKQFHRVSGHLHLRALRDTLERITETVTATHHAEGVDAS
jgi:hypothetical protein